MRGAWINELGSIINIYDITSDGYMSGSYVNAATSFTSPCSMVGSFDQDGVAIGWNVFFNGTKGNTHTVTSWVGNYDFDKGYIHTTWIMKTMPTSPSDDWKTITIGNNVFTRNGSSYRFRPT